jgi:hypothetical protein
MQEVIINPTIALEAQNGEFLEINDFLQEADEEVIQIIRQNLDFNLNGPLAPPEEPLHADILQVPHVNHPIEPMIDEEIPLHMLVDPIILSQIQKMRMMKPSRITMLTWVSLMLVQSLLEKSPSLIPPSYEGITKLHLKPQCFGSLQ